MNSTRRTLALGGLVCLEIACSGNQSGNESAQGGAVSFGGATAQGGVANGGTTTGSAGGGGAASSAAANGGAGTGGASSGGAAGGIGSGGAASAGEVSARGGSPSRGGNSAGTGGASAGAPSNGGSGGENTGSGGAASGGANSANGGSNGGQPGSANATLVPDPSWTCGMPDGIPSPTGGTLVFSVALEVSATHVVGETQYGQRRQLDVSGGTITGTKLKGTVLTGGLDYELTLSTGALELEEVLIYKASDNTSIFVRNCGVAAPGDSVVRIVPDIEAPTSGSYAWLNTTKLVGTRTVSGDKITLDIYDVSNLASAGDKIKLKDPPGVPNTSWDCVGGNGSKGDTVFTENVTLGASFSVSNAKRGSRNVIPITGGTTTGKVAGKILNGGADYQLAGSSGTTLDARYTLAPSDGNFIIVRNCGPINALVPPSKRLSTAPITS